ncbi:hypothetical protein BMS3Abin03_01409 [bacterium BMS3Abin03]|nr:hypothetical protein BMS3Abin03_01409 [bacterium BMS3Abin03]
MQKDLIAGAANHLSIFLNYSYRSASEVQSLLYVSIDLQYVNIEQFNDLYNRAKEIKNLIGGLINKTHYELITHLD